MSVRDDRGRASVRGKSELHRAGCWVTPSEGDFKESATEIYRLNDFFRGIHSNKLECINSTNQIVDLECHLG